MRLLDDNDVVCYHGLVVPAECTEMSFGSLCCTYVDYFNSAIMIKTKKKDMKKSC